MYEIYTDGAYMSSIGCGGCAAIILHEGNIVKKLYQGYKKTTNNRMEMRGVLMALEYFKEPETLTIYSDSSYVVNTIRQKHCYRWFDEQDYSKKNLDLWYAMVNLLEHHDVNFVWVKGHANNHFNEIADLYSVHACTCLNLPFDMNKNGNQDYQN